MSPLSIWAGVILNHSMQQGKSSTRLEAEKLIKQGKPLDEIKALLFKQSGYESQSVFSRKVNKWAKELKVEPSVRKENLHTQKEPETGTKWDEQKDAATWEYKGTYHGIKTLDDALKFSKVDLEIWEVERHVFNSWETTLADDAKQPIKTTNIQVKVWFRRKRVDLMAFSKNLISEIKKISPYVPLKSHKSTPAEKLLEIDIFDPHFGKLAWGKETGEDYDTNIAVERYMAALNSLLNRGSKVEKIDRILFPIGNDLFHTDTVTKTTTAGTPQDVDTRWQKMWLTTRKTVMDGILMATQVAPVDIVIVPSNHDFQTMFYLGDLLQCAFENNRNITVNNDPRSRKYYKWGKCGLGLTHSNEEKVNELPLIMLQETKKEWSDVKFMEWHVGHIHKQKHLQFVTTDDIKGIRVRYLMSISGTDAWHYLKGYINSIKGAEGFIWDKQDGVICNIMHNL